MQSYTWMHLVFNLPCPAVNTSQDLRDSTWEALDGKLHVLLPDGQGTVQAVASQLKIIHGHLH